MFKKFFLSFWGYGEIFTDFAVKGSLQQGTDFTN